MVRYILGSLSRCVIGKEIVKGRDGGEDMHNQIEFEYLVGGIKQQLVIKWQISVIGPRLPGFTKRLKSGLA